MISLISSDSVVGFSVYLTRTGEMFRYYHLRIYILQSRMQFVYILLVSYVSIRVKNSFVFILIIV